MGAAKRIQALSALLAHAHAMLELKIGFQLWDGSRVPADWPEDGLMVALADEGVIASVVRRPNADTLANLWCAKRIDILNGTIFDVAERRPNVRTRKIRGKLNKRLIAQVGWQFLFVDRGGPWPLAHIGETDVSDGSQEENTENVHYHYDISNAFYELFLDEQMVYTCGYATDWNNDIDQMQRDKLEMICRKLRLKPGDRMLDIGCGWGSLACYAARNFGVTVVGVSLAEEQIAFAREKAERLGLSDKVEFRFIDYARMDGKFDKISSIGMHEHMGIKNYPTYYSTVRKLLKDDGLYLHHAITRPAKKNNRTFHRKKNSGYSLLTRYIFPGGELDHIGNTLMMLEQYGFEVHDVEGWREHYQRTCRLWHDRILARYDEAVAEVGEAKTRLWIAYLAACSIAFQRNTVYIFQTLVSPKRRGTAGLPPTRADLYG